MVHMVCAFQSKASETAQLLCVKNEEIFKVTVHPKMRESERFVLFGSTEESNTGPLSHWNVMSDLWINHSEPLG